MRLTDPLLHGRNLYGQDPAALKLRQGDDALGLSARAYNEILKTALTIAKIPALTAFRNLSHTSITDARSGRLWRILA